MPSSKTTDSLAPFRRRARLRQVWRWLRWVLLVLVIATLLGGVLLRHGRAETGVSVVNRDVVVLVCAYTAFVPVHVSTGAR